MLIFLILPCCWKIHNKMQFRGDKLCHDADRRYLQLESKKKKKKGNNHQFLKFQGIDFYLLLLGCPSILSLKKFLT